MAHVRRRLRSRFVKQQKRRKNLYRKLIKEGIGKKLAANTLYSNKGNWNLSYARTVEKVFSNEWFEKMGLKIVSTLGLSDWLPINKFREVNVKSRVRTCTHGSVRGWSSSGSSSSISCRTSPTNFF